MNNKENKKTKPEKLQELRFWFEGGSKKYKAFRENPIYRAILEAIDRSNYEDFLTLDIMQDFQEHNPKALETLGLTLQKGFSERSIGSRLKQLVQRSMLEIKEENSRVRQKTFRVDRDVSEEFKEYVRKLLNKRT